MDDLERRLMEHENRIATLEANVNLIPKKDDMEEMIHRYVGEAISKAIDKYLLTKGGKLKTGLVAAGIIVASIVAIGGGIKIILGWIGLTIMRG